MEDTAILIRNSFIATGVRLFVCSLFDLEKFEHIL